MADHTAIQAEVRELAASGDTVAAKRVLRRYVGGADDALAGGLVDQARDTLDREAEAYAARIQAARRERYRSETADGPRRVSIRRGASRTPRTRTAARNERRAEQYFTQRDDTAPSDERAEEAIYASGIDYDLAAVTPMRGRGCLFCGIERSESDRRRRDGLCADCRADGLTRDDYIAMRCAQLTERVTREGHASPRDALAAVWKRANAADRALIERWAESNPQRLSGAIH